MLKEQWGTVFIQSLFRHVSLWVSEVKALQIIAMPRRKRATHMNVHYIMSVGKRAWY